MPLRDLEQKDHLGDLNTVGGSGHTAFELGMMSTSHEVRKLVKKFKMRSKCAPLERIDVRLDELHRIHVSDAVEREIFEGVVQTSAEVCRHHGEWHDGVFAILSEGVAMDDVAKGIKNDNPFVTGF